MAGTRLLWSFNQSANATVGGSGSMNSAAFATLASSGLSAGITPAPSTTFGNSSTFSGNGSFPSISLNATNLVNDTQCWISYWSYTDAAYAWTKEHTRITTTTMTRVQTLKYTIPATPTGNYTVLCDGIPRFGSEKEAEAAFAPISFATPVITTSFITTTVVVYPTYPYTRPVCSIKDSAECSNLWGLYATSRSRSLSSWSSTNVLTVSLASPPDSMVVNGQTTILEGPAGDLPVITLHGTAFTPSHGFYSISNATSLTGEPIITPGGEGIFTWNGNDIYQLAYGPRDKDCNGAPPGKVISSQCATAQCTIAAQHVELLYFPPPSTSRDICAYTSPGYNSYSVSIFSQPHASTVINSTTFWSDKAYVRYSALSAYKKCSIDNLIDITTMPVGGVYSDQYVEVASSDISTICSWRWNPALHVEPIGGTAFPANFDDLNGPIPASAYRCIAECYGKCSLSSIVSEKWQPGLAVPSQIRAIDPAWASCVPFFLGVPDPPIALAPRSFLSTTANVPPVSDPPSPGITPSPIGKPTNDPPSNPDPAPTARPPQSNPDPPADPPGNSPPGNDPPSSEPLGNNAPPVNAPAPIPTRFTQTVPISPPTEPADPADPAANDPPTAPITTVGGRPINVDPSNPGNVIIGNPGDPAAQTMHPGDNPVVVGGTTLSISPTGGSLVVSGQSSLIPVGSVGDQTVWMDPSRPNVVFIGDPSSPQQTLSVNGGVSVISGTTVSLALPTGVVSASGSMTIVGMSFAIDPSSGVLMVEGKYTIQPGAAQISVNGHTIFFDPNGSSVYVDGVEYSLALSLVMNHDGTTSTVEMPLGSAAIASTLSALAAANLATGSAADATLTSTATADPAQVSSDSSQTKSGDSPFDSTAVGSAPGIGTGGVTGTAKPNSATALSMLIDWHWSGFLVLMWIIRWNVH